jgi:hypothetical protein
MKKEINKNLYCPIKLKNCVHEKIIELGKQPPANNLKINKSQFINEYDLNVFHCKKCNLLQHDANISPKKLYSNYNGKPMRLMRLWGCKRNKYSIRSECFWRGTWTCSIK